MEEQYRKNFFRLVAVIVDVVYLVIRKYIKEKILGSDSFESFLNKEKHKLVHIFETSKCCECTIPSIQREKLISHQQFLMLYKSNKRNLISNHKKYAGGKLTQICICEYSAKANIDVRVVDITLANYIIQKCGKHECGIDNWIEQIKDVRNEIFHLSDIQELTDDEFSRKWTTLGGSITGIANVIGIAYAVEIEKNIMQAKKLTIIGDYMLKAQNQVITEKAAALHHTMPQHFTRSMESDCQQTMKKIEYLNTMVDKIDIMINIFGSEENVEMLDATNRVTEDNKRILIPVFMQLDIPTSWDKTKVFEAIDEFRLTGTPDMNIRIKAISIDDLNMYAEIAKQVLGNVHELRSEINKMMSTMLSEAEIDTKEHAKVHVNLEVLNESGVLNAESIIESKEEIGKLTDSAVNQRCSTTESNGVSTVDNIIEKEEEIGKPLDLSTTQECSTTEPKEITPTTACTEEAIVQISLKNNFPVSANFRQKLKISKKHFWNKDPRIYSCIKTGNTLVFTDCNNNRLIICNSDGTDIHHIPLSYKPWYITEIDSNTVAVSCIFDNTILIINISTRSVTSTIKTSGDCRGISYNDNNLYGVIDGSIIHVMDLTGKVIRTIPVPTDDIIRDITVDRDRLVCIDDRSIYCCSLDGKVMWKFKKDEFQDLTRVTTDNEGNVYVTDERTHTVIVVSDDGKHHRELLTKSDGLR
ncbi:unnamed protein product [Mytilus edulis]|uniref:DZIP3-like HEPN domain-containing protein n=1 Tax=Mytilus edulis TaxID=6550 RepID=A0A8S3RB10_MYTED|nr:unnamed protein product [Mytilus edulis]